jgi:hypothetical protein
MRCINLSIRATSVVVDLRGFIGRRTMMVESGCNARATVPAYV